MGLTDEQINQPLVGVATTWNEAAPCNIALSRQAQAAKKGVAAAGGTPREFTTITVTDGIAMGHEGMKSSLVSREVIANSVELTMRGHCYDALVGLAGCDKSLPGLMMAMVRLNVPSVFMYGGSILPGRFKGKDVTIGDVFEGVGAHNVGKMSDEDLHELECAACPSAGSCGGLFTANTMACVSEAIGLALPGSAGAPAPYDSRDAYAEASGQAVMELLRRNLRPRDIVTRKALENAATVVAAAGGSTNAGLHLPAIANEAGIDFDLHDVGEIFKRTPYIGDLKPGGRYVMKDLHDIGGVPVLMKALLDGGYLHGDCMTVTGKTIAENLRDVKFPTGQDVVRPTSNALSPTGGVVVLKGNLAPQGAIVKVAGMKTLRFDRHGAVLRLRGGCVRRGRDAALQGRRHHRHPLRGAERRARHARDAVDDGGALRPGRRREGGADHRRPLFGRDARLLHRPCRAGGGGRRADRLVARRRQDHDRRRRRHDRRRAERRRAGRAAPRLDAAPQRLPVGHAVEIRADRRRRRKGRRHPPRRARRNPRLRRYLATAPTQNSHG